MLRIYFTLFIFSLCLNAQAKFVIISDIDDTIKKTHLVNPLKAIISFAKNEDGPYPYLRNIISDLLLAHEEATIIYLSSSYENIYNATNWLLEHQFPPGLVFQRTLASPLNGRLFKQNKLNELYNKGLITQEDHILFF